MVPGTDRTWEGTTTSCRRIRLRAARTHHVVHSTQESCHATHSPQPGGPRCRGDGQTSTARWAPSLTRRSPWNPPPPLDGAAAAEPSRPSPRSPRSSSSDSSPSRDHEPRSAPPPPTASTPSPRAPSPSPTTTAAPRSCSPSPAWSPAPPPPAASTSPTPAAPPPTSSSTEPSPAPASPPTSTPSSTSAPEPPADTGFNCTGFTAGVNAFTNTLATFGTTHTNYGNGNGTNFAAATTGTTRSYRVTVTLPDTPAVVRRRPEPQRQRHLHLGSPEHLSRDPDAPTVRITSPRQRPGDRPPPAPGLSRPGRDATNGPASAGTPPARAANDHCPSACAVVDAWRAVHADHRQRPDPLREPVLTPAGVGRMAHRRPALAQFPQLGP